MKLRITCHCHASMRNIDELVVGYVNKNYMTYTLSLKIKHISNMWFCNKSMAKYLLYGEHTNKNTSTNTAHINSYECTHKHSNINTVTNNCTYTCT